MSQKKKSVVIDVDCIGCHKENELELTLPTAMRCKHCGMIFDARMSINMERLHGHVLPED